VRVASVNEEHTNALLIAQTNAALRDLRAMQLRLDVVTRERDLLRLTNARLSVRIVQQAKRLNEIRAQASRALPRVFDAFARLVLEDIAARD